MTRILLTGANGFLGKAFVKSLADCMITGLDVINAKITCDLSKDIPSVSSCHDIVIHCAGKAHSVPRTLAEKNNFFDVNYLGTKNLCTGLDRSGFKPKTFIFISTVSVYGLEYGNGIAETSPLKGTTPYALSKIQAESFVKSWALKNDINYLILRLPLIVSDNPPGNLGKMIHAIKKGFFLKVNGGVARKSMIVASDLSKLILNNTDKSGIYNLTDGVHPSFKEIEDLILQKMDLRPSLNLPMALAKLLSLVGEGMPFFPFNKVTLIKMTEDLTFDDSRARRELSWSPTLVKEVFNELNY